MCNENVKHRVKFSFPLCFSVYQVFENVAQKYDVMNDAMSLGIHRLWKDMLLHVMHPQPGVRLLDVAGGTGKVVVVHLSHPPNKTPALSRSVSSVDAPPQVTSPSGSWSSFALSRSGSRDVPSGPCRRHHGGTFLLITPLRM